MDYINSNKLAWEDAFENRTLGWGDNHLELLLSKTLPFFNMDVIAAIQEIDISGKTIAQFCCNNGRELLSAMQLKPEYGIGFDIAENFIEQAKQLTKKLGYANCEFVACNLIDIDKAYYNRFDFIFFTVGAITWFKDLNLLFNKVSMCLKKYGKLLINDYHPFMNMLPVPGEEVYNYDNPKNITYSYFTNEPWIDNKGMSYITPQYQSKTFTSFHHSVSDIINSVVNSGISVIKFNEYDYDVGLSDAYNNMGIPLSFILIGEKR